MVVFLIFSSSFFIFHFFIYLFIYLFWLSFLELGVSGWEAAKFICFFFLFCFFFFLFFLQWGQYKGSRKGRLDNSTHIYAQQCTKLGWHKEWQTRWKQHSANHKCCISIYQCYTALVRFGCPPSTNVLQSEVTPFPKVYPPGGISSRWYITGWFRVFA